MRDYDSTVIAAEREDSRDGCHTVTTVAVSEEPAVIKPQGLRARALLIGLPLLVGVCIISVYADMVSQVVQFGVMQLAPPAVAVLFGLGVLNLASRRWNRKDWLSPADILVIYAMLLVGVLISTRGVIEKLVPALAYLPYYATRENKLNELITRHLPSWAVPFMPSAQAGPPPDVIRGYWEGAATKPIPWSAWFGPLCAWMVLVGCVIWVLLCLATILRRQWMDNEQIRFPLATLPLAVVRDETEGEPFLTNRVMWLGFGLATFIYTINGLHANFPDWPQFPLVISYGSLFTERPWNAMQSVTIFLSVAAIGFAYFLPADLLFSMWFFYGLTRVQDIGAAALGAQPAWDTSTGSTFWHGYQAVGAYIVLIIAQLRIGWPYYQKVWQTAFGRSSELALDDSGELMSYRAALLGLLLGFGGIVLWLAIAGVNPLLAAAEMGIYLFIICTVMARGVCEAGLLGTGGSFMPSHIINLVYPLPAWGTTNLAMMGMTDTVFMRDWRGMLLPSFLDSQKVAKEIDLRPRVLFAPLVLASIVSLVTASAFYLYLHYAKGGLSLYSYPKWNAVDAYNRAAGAMDGSTFPRDSTTFGALAVGVIVMSLLMWLRTQFAWFPFHPLGYALAPAGTMNVYWFPFFAAWLIKSTVLKYGGIETYRKLAPFMLGLIGGEFMSGMFWAVMNMWRGWSAPGFPWP